MRGWPSCVRKCSRARLNAACTSPGRVPPRPRSSGRPKAAPALHTLLQRGELPAQDQKRRLERSGVEEAIESAPHRREHVEERRRATPAAVGTSRSRGPTARNRDRTAGATMRRSSSAASPARARRSPKLREHQRHVLVLAGEAAADAQRAVERLVDEPRHLGVVGHRESGVEVGLERKLAQQREAERVNRADGDVAVRSRSSRQRARGISPRPAASRSVATMRSRISAAALRVKVMREDVRRIDAGAQQVDVAIDEHARLAGAGRCLERDVEAADPRPVRVRHGRGRRSATRRSRAPAPPKLRPPLRAAKAGPRRMGAGS